MTGAPVGDGPPVPLPFAGDDGLIAWLTGGSSGPLISVLLAYEL